MITTFVGVASLIVGVLIGHFQGYLMGVKVRNLKRLVMDPSPLSKDESTTCLCSHGKNTHYGRGRGRCCVEVRDGRCACQRFVPKPRKKPKEPADILDLSQ